MKNKFFILVAMMLPLVFASCSPKGGEEPPQPNGGDTTPVITLNGVDVSVDDAELGAYGRFFSTSLNQAFKQSEITDEIAPKIDLALFNMSSSQFLFISPDHTSRGVGKTNATKTEYMLDQKCEMITAEQFDALSKNSDFEQFAFTPDGKMFNSSDKLPFFCFFKNAAGKIGVVKITALVSEGRDAHITADIKIQK